MTQPEKKPDGRANNGGARPGSGKKADPIEGVRVKAAPTFKPSDWSWLKATAKERGAPVTRLLDEAIADYRVKETENTNRLLPNLRTRHPCSLPEPVTNILCGNRGCKNKD